MAYRLVYDITSKVIKCAIGDGSDTIVAMDQAEPEIIVSEDGFGRECNSKTYWNDLINLTKTTIKKASIDPAEIKFITCSSIRPSCVFSDEDYNAIYIGAGFDVRGIENAAELDEEFEDITGESFFQATGHFPSLMFSPARYAWFKENEPESCGKITNYLPMDSWVLTKLGGEEHANLCSAAESGFFNIRTKDWNYEWFDILDLPRHFLPFIVSPGEIVGDASEQIQELLGLGDNVSIVAGLPDTQAALVGAGCVNENDVGIVVGSTTPIQMLNKDLIIDNDMKVWTTALSLKDVIDFHVIEASNGITGQVLKWTGALFYSNEGKFEKEFYANIDADYESFDKDEIEGKRESKDVFAFLGPNYLASANETILPGAFIMPLPGSPEVTYISRKQFIGSMFENIQFATFKNVKYLHQLSGNDMNDHYLLGGVTRSETFCQRFADLLDEKVITTREAESTIMGLFLVCACAEGKIKSRDDLLERVKKRGEMARKLPRENLTASIRNRFERWDVYRKKIDQF